MATHRNRSEQEPTELPVVPHPSLADLLQQVSTDLIRAGTEHLDAATDTALAALLHFVGADRGAIFLATDNAPDMTVAYRCAVRGVEPLPHGARARDEGIGATWCDHLERGESVAVANTADVALAERHPAERQILVRSGVRSMVIQPLRADGALFGAVRLDAVRATRPDLARQVDAVGSVASLISAAMVRGREVYEAEQAAHAARDRAEQGRENAERASLAKSEFLTRMSHELRTPLNALLGFSQLLELAGLSGEDADNLHHIIRAGRHLLDLINDALDVARIETGRLSMSLEPVEFGAVAEESLDLVRPDAARGSVHLTALPADSLGYEVVADRQRLKQVLVNLLSNAVKYNRTGGRVTVECAPLGPTELVPAGPPVPNGWLRIAVCDNGKGVPEDRVDDMFLPFERIGAEFSEVEGTGLGLALAKSMVEAMGGRIGVHSVYGMGTTFYVDLPAAARAEPSAEPIIDVPVDSSDQPGAGSTPVHTILYIEDNPSNLMLVRRVLARRPQVRLLVAREGDDGLRVFREQRPDLVLLDLHLPRHAAGAEVLAAIRDDADPRLADVPVVVVTADLTAGSERRLLQAGANAFLGKPLDLPRLLQTIDALLRDPAIAGPTGAATGPDVGAPALPSWAG